MIDEAVLERLLRDEAGTYDPPPDGPERIVAAAAEERRPQRTPWLAAAAAVVALAIGVPLAMDNGALDSVSGRGVRSSGENLTTGGDTDAGGGKVLPVMDELGPTDDGAEPNQLGYGRAADSAHVVRTGDVWVEVPEARVAETLRTAARIAAQHGGYVAESASETATDSPSGSVTIRVPVDKFDRAVDDVSRLGDVRQSGTKGEDVTDQVTDTAARLKTLTATRAQLQALMARAKDVGEVLAVQSKVTEVQTQIEQLQARQASLTDRTTYGTLRVSVSPPGGAEERDGFSKAWHDAVDGFVGGFETLVAASGTIAFLLVVGLALFFLLRRGYRVWVRGVV